MLQRICLVFLTFFLSFAALAAEENQGVKETHIHIESGVVYCDVQTFNQESYILKVLGGGSSMTVFWQFEVLKEQKYWMNQSAALVRLGRQVIPDLVTKRWLMRDLSSGVVAYTTNIHTAMTFLTEMHHAAVMDVSLLVPNVNYLVRTKLFIHEGEWEEGGWWTSITNWGEEMGTVSLFVPDENEETN